MLSIQIETIQTCARCDLISKQLNSLEIHLKIKYNKIILYKCALLQKYFRIVVTFAAGLIKISSHQAFAKPVTAFRSSRSTKQHYLPN